MGEKLAIRDLWLRFEAQRRKGRECVIGGEVVAVVDARYMVEVGVLEEGPPVAFEFVSIYETERGRGGEGLHGAHECVK